MEQCAGCRDVLSAVGVGKEPIVADAVSAKTAIAIVRNRPQYACYTGLLPKELFTTIRNRAT